MKKLSALLLLRQGSVASRGALLTLLLIAAAGAHAASCEFELGNEWGSGFSSSIHITNDGDQQIDGWSVEIAFPDGTSITNMWNASLTGDGPYVATSKSYNARINPGDRRSFGFNSRKATPNAPAALPALGGICSVGAPDDQRPMAAATASPLSGVLPLAVTFDGSQSSDPEGAALSYHWDFGDGSASSSVSPSKTFETAGTHVVTLTVDDGNHESAAAQLVITVQEPEPEDALCRYEVVNDWPSGFTGSVEIVNDGDTATRGWSVTLVFPDGSTIAGLWDGHLSGNGSPYEVTNASYNELIAPGASVSFGFNGNKASSGSPAPVPTLGGHCRADAVVNRPPVAQIGATPPSGDAPLTVAFDGSGSSDLDDDPLTYAWDFGAGDTASSVQVSRVFDQPGNYPVTLTVSDGALVSETASVTIAVTAPPAGVDRYVLVPEQSSLYFVSTKNVDVIETHRFATLTGTIESSGAASVRIDLDSIDSGIEIRDERMRAHLFETMTFPAAEATASVDWTELAALAPGAGLEQTIQASIALHGFGLETELPVRITRMSASVVLVQTRSPVLVDAVDFGLDVGIEALRGIAGLDVISHAVPVNFTLVFRAE